MSIASSTFANVFSCINTMAVLNLFHSLTLYQRYAHLCVVPEESYKIKIKNETKISCNLLLFTA